LYHVIILQKPNK